jgi:hypothetical protein
VQDGGCRERSGRRTTASGALLATGALAALAAVAFAAEPHGGPDRGTERKPGSPPPWRPAILRHPDRVEVSTTARFDFRGKHARRFRCRLDHRRWKDCRAPIAFAELAPGRHAFAVRAFDRSGRRSAPALFRWRILEPKDFAIVPQLSGIGSLYPGAPAIALPVTIANPNPVPILITGLRVVATADPPGCSRAENLSLWPASLSRAAPLRVPAGRTAHLPGAGVSAPAIQLRDLPISQDACQNARFPLAFSGEAHG